MHHMAIVVWNIKESRCRIHYLIASNVSDQLRILNIWSRIICYGNDCQIDLLNVHFVYGTLLSVYRV